ncbi:MAG: hypothetical protein JSV88_12560, partial [Candidatus Aminicenantes bacterium]
LSFNQKRLWIIHQQDPLDNSYNMMGIIVMNQQVEVETIKRTADKLIERHESLRTGFKEVEGRGVQYVVEKDSISLPPVNTKDISSLEESQKQNRVKTILAEFNNRLFHLDEPPPLFRWLLVKAKEDLYIFAYCMHHIVSDGWSMEILEKDFHYIYNAYLNNSDMDPPQARITYKDFARWHNRQLENASGNRVSREFWIRFLKEELPMLRLPGDFDNPINTTVNRKPGASFRFVISTGIKDALKQISKRHNITLFSLLFSIYNIFLAMVSGQRIVVSSIVNAGRAHPALQEVIGFFVNSVIFKIEIKEDIEFIDFAHHVQQSVLEFFTHQNYPLELVLDEVGIAYPEVAVSFNMLNISSKETVPLENTASLHTPETQNVKFQLEPYISEYSNGIEIIVSYNKDRFKPENIEYMMEKYQKLMEFFAIHPHNQIKDFKETSKRRSFKRKKA